MSRCRCGLLALHVMAGLVPAIHVFLRMRNEIGGRPQEVLDHANAADVRVPSADRTTKNGKAAMRGIC